MPGRKALPINSQLAIPLEELSFRFSRSSGAGGQHVNTTSSRVTLIWNLTSSNALNDRQRERLIQKLSRRINSEGELLIHSEKFRSQNRNREDCLERLRDIIQEALKVQKKRVPTKPSKGSVEKRLKSKHKKSEIKKSRGRFRED